jgi:pimeloyl-ACP methyl ester carboxylesterase
MPSAADLYYYAYPAGQNDTIPVVLIHGAGGTHLFWPVEVRRLPGYRILALDLPGHGKSGGCCQQSIQAYASQVTGWMDAIGLRQAVWVGHSMGAAICLALAIQFPERVLGIGLVGGGASLPVRSDILEYAASPRTLRKAIEILVSLGFSASANSRLVELAGQRMLETRPSVFYGDLLACNSFDVTEQLREIRRPCLVLCGSEDQLTPPRKAQFLASTIRRARLRTIPEAGHMVMLEQPQAVAEALVDFLDGILPKRKIRARATA